MKFRRVVVRVEPSTSVAAARSSMGRRRAWRSVVRDTRTRIVVVPRVTLKAMLPRDRPRRVSIRRVPRQDAGHVRRTGTVDPRMIATAATRSPKRRGAARAGVDGAGPPCPTATGGAGAGAGATTGTGPGTGTGWDVPVPNPVAGGTGAGGVGAGGSVTSGGVMTGGVGVPLEEGSRSVTVLVTLAPAPAAVMACTDRSYGTPRTSERKV